METGLDASGDVARRKEECEGGDKNASFTRAEVQAALYFAGQARYGGKQLLRMRTQPVPGTNLSVSSLIFGTAQFGLKQTEPEAHALLDQYVAAGGTMIDTARIYSDWVPGETGRSERIIGDWLRTRGRSRESPLIATKGLHYHFDDPSRSRVTFEAASFDVDLSLQVLGVDAIDLYWLHRDNPEVPVSEIVDFMQTFVEGGKIRYLGASNWTVERFQAANAHAASKGYHGFMASQILYNLGSWNLRPLPDPTLVAMDRVTYTYHQETKFPVFAYSSQATGVFSKFVERGVKFDALSEDFHATEANAQLAPTLAELARAKECSVNAIVLAYLLHQPLTLFPVIGADRSEQLNDSLSALKINLSMAELQMLEDAAGSGIRHG